MSLPDHKPYQSQINWEFQVNQQGFIARYGRGGDFYYKQVILQSGHVMPVYPIKRIDKRIYETAQRIASAIE